MVRTEGIPTCVRTPKSEDERRKQHASARQGVDRTHRVTQHSSPEPLQRSWFELPLFFFNLQRPWQSLPKRGLPRHRSTCGNSRNSRIFATQTPHDDFAGSNADDAFSHAKRLRMARRRSHGARSTRTAPLPPQPN